MTTNERATLTNQIVLSMPVDGDPLAMQQWVERVGFIELIEAASEIRTALENNAAPMEVLYALRKVECITLNSELARDLCAAFIHTRKALEAQPATGGEHG